jgi:DNA-directed RNA polymerase specialized sigma54-like protein
MSSQELRNLQEAYMEVVENQQENVSEMFGFGRKKGKSPLADALMNSDYMKKKNKEADEKAIQNLKDMLSQDPERQKRPSRINNEQVDIYDIILTHLLDEGYAETPEAAEAIMVNMSEEWRDSIIG